MIRLVATLVALSLTAPAGAATLRRIGVVVSSNDGGPGRPRLRYAEADAKAFAAVLEELGDLQTGDLVVATSADRASLERALAEAASRARAAKGPDTRVEVLLYYSGHSDDQGLLPAGQSYPYADLRAALAAMQADVRIAVLDSCASGALTREKGGVRRPAFAVDQAAQVRGHAFLTSSSDDEAAQESDRIGGSFFTHYLVSGLRGAADSSGDGKVTLTEAYQFAYDETLNRTERTRGGPQHAAYDIQLAGTGDLVLTDLRSTASGLDLPKPMSGRIFVRDASDRLLVELRKTAGQDVELGLPAGRYRVTVENGRSVSEATLEVPSGGKATLAAASLQSVTREATAFRGDDLRQEPFHFSMIPVASDADIRAGMVIQFPVGQLGALDGLELGLVGSKIYGDVRGLQLDAVGSLVGGSVKGAQFSGTGFIVEGNLEGIQASGAFTLTLGELKGLQYAGGLAFAGDLKGMQAAPALRANRMQGAQFGLVNSLGTGKGAQFGLVNQATSITGFQHALVNVAGDVDGMQLGQVNVATGNVKGLQFGVVNVAHDASSTIGLFNWVDTGRMDIDMGANSFGSATLALHTGTARGFYGLLEGSYRPNGANRIFTAGGGFGHRITAGPADFNVEVDAQQLWRGEQNPRNLMTGVRGTVGFRILPQVGLYAGAEYDAIFQWDNTYWNPNMAYQKVDVYEGLHIVRFPAIVAGLRVVPHGF